MLIKPDIAGELNTQNFGYVFLVLLLNQLPLPFSLLQFLMSPLATSLIPDHDQLDLPSEHLMACRNALLLVHRVFV